MENLEGGNGGTTYSTKELCSLAFANAVNDHSPTPIIILGAVSRGFYRDGKMSVRDLCLTSFWSEFPKDVLIRFSPFYYTVIIDQ